MALPARIYKQRQLPDPAKVIFEDVNYLFRQSRAENTRKAYAKDLQCYENWCAHSGVNPYPADPKHLILYMRYLWKNRYKPSTIERRIAAITYRHRKLDHNPTNDENVREFLAGIKRDLGAKQDKKAPLLTSHIKLIVDKLEDRVNHIRDRALLLIGYAGALRRSEIVNIRYEDIEFTDEGLRLTIRKSKTDQEGKGREIGITYGSYRKTCPVRNLKQWLDVANINEGPIFRRCDRHGNIYSEAVSPNTVNRVVKRCVKSIGQDPADYGAHSLRAGFITQADMNGTRVSKIQEQTGHKSVRVLMGYIRSKNLFEENASGNVGL